MHVLELFLLSCPFSLELLDSGFQGAPVGLGKNQQFITLKKREGLTLLTGFFYFTCVLRTPAAPPSS